MRVAFLAIALMGLVVGANAGAVDLTSANFDAEVLESGKAAFVKFLAPWCVFSLLPEPRTPAASIPRSPPRRIQRLGSRASIDPPRARTHRRPGDGTIVPWRHRRCIPRGTTARVSERRRSTPRWNPRCQTSPRPHSPRHCFFGFFFGFFVKHIADPFPSPSRSTGEATASR